MASSDSQILMEEKSYARTLILNRPRQLNALSHEMILQLLKMFLLYEEDRNVNLVIVKGKGRAFCAGGDVSSVTDVVIRGHWSYGAAFFYKEYTLNYILATYTKPQVSFLDGIVMGGGAGISMHGKFRVVTENTVFAMPETALGLFPDTGASYFLSRLPGFYGEYLGLTGGRLDGSEMLACGLATHFIFSKSLPLLEEALYEVDTTDPAIVSAIIDRFSEKVPLKSNTYSQRLRSIDRCFSKETVEEILSALENEARNVDDEWIADTLSSLQKASPTSLKISLRSIREGRVKDIGQCLIQEYRIVCHVLQRGISNDFFEGSRALLKDKDRNPKWEPSKLELVTKEMVDKYFTEVDDFGWEDLKFPVRPFLDMSTRAKL